MIVEEDIREGARDGVPMWTLYCLECLRENGPFDFKCCSECGGSFEIVPATSTGVLLVVEESE